MAGEAPDVGTGILAGALAGILGALTGTTEPTQEPVPVAPSIDRPTPIMVFGIPLTTLALFSVGAFLAFKFLK